MLAEDETVNRLEDSVLLWKSICSNPLLGKTNLILFLNKIDIFNAKLESGIPFGQYIISYGNRPNDYTSTSACESFLHRTCARCRRGDLYSRLFSRDVVDMRRKFGQIHKEYSPQARTFYCHFTAVTVRVKGSSDLWLPG